MIVKFHRIYGNYTMETIMASAFGRVIEIQKGQSSQLTKAATASMGSINQVSVSNLEVLATILSWY